MPPTSLLLIHAGMRPGEIIIAHADGRDPVFVPPSDHVHNYLVGKNQNKEEWVILRHYSERQPPDALLAFPSESLAEQALAELHKALLEPAPAPAPTRTRELLTHYGPHLAAGLFILLMILLSTFGHKKAISTTEVPMTSQSSSLDGFTPPAATSQEPPPPSPSSSPGDDILRQIQQGNTQQGDTQQAPQVAPTAPPATTAAPQPAAASPGDALLQQIKGR